jgi:hypothetical protein
MALVFDVLHVTRNAVGLVRGDERPLRPGFDVTVVTLAASGARRLAVDGIESLMTTRARQLAFGISGESVGADPLYVKRMKLFAVPVIVAVGCWSGHRDLLQCPVRLA